LIIVGSLGVPLGLSMALSGRLSDRARLRRPFMALGLLCFGGLAILFASTSGPGGAGLGQLAALWPLTAALAAGAGMFPPAALAYLGDIVERSVSGTSFGVYSIIFGSGLIIGPILGGALTERLGSLAFAVLALGFIGVSATGVAFIREPAKAAPAAAAKASGPPQRD
jgi:MFS family permease